MSIFHFVLLGGALVLLAFALLANRRDGETPSQVAHDPEDGKLSAVPVSEESPTEVELPSSARDIPKTAPTREWDGVFALDEVFDNPDCMIRQGVGATKGTAVVVISDEGGGSRFKILDAEGTLFEGEFPFRGQEVSFGRSENQSMVVAVGDTRPNSGVLGENESPQPVRIYRGGSVVYEASNTRQFLVANNGSSFVTMERRPQKTHVLKIRRFEPFVEHEVDLGRRALSAGNHFLYGVGFSDDGREVKLSPYRWGRPLRFFPVDPNGEPVAFWEDETDVLDASAWLIPNRSLGYFIKGYHNPDSDWARWRVWKETYEWENGMRQTTIEWETHFHSNTKGYGTLSNGGRYYIHMGEVVRVLNADTGELLFAFPTEKAYGDAPEFKDRKRSETEGYERRVYQGKLARERLRSVEYPDEVGYPGSARTVYASDVELIINHTVLRGGNLDCRTVPAVEYFDCLDRARDDRGARYEQVLDAFPIEGLTIDSEPARRSPYQREYSCVRQDILFQGLELVDGTFRFRRVNAWH